jgi:hypothetical protein
MRILIHNTVKTDTSDYTFATREEAEAFYMSLRVERGAERQAGAQQAAAGNPPGRRRARPRPATH